MAEESKTEEVIGWAKKQGSKTAVKQAVKLATRSNAVSWIIGELFDATPLNVGEDERIQEWKRKDAIAANCERRDSCLENRFYYQCPYRCFLSGEEQK